VERANTYDEYCEIELFEPQNAENHVHKPIQQNMTRISSTPTSPRSGFGLRKRNTKSQTGNEQTQQPESPRRLSVEAINLSHSSSPSSPMRKTHSCLDFSITPKTLKRSTSSPVKRVLSTASLQNDPSRDEDEENCPEWQKIVREDLGMAGDMLITTMARLREARMQASSINTHRDVNGHDVHHIEDGENDRSYHITSFSSNSPGKQNNEDYSSSLKFLLSGIIKRNHLSVDDALINDCRSIAERGQHSLRKETRDAIDRYGDEVERCMEWVASGPVYLGAGNDSSKIAVDGGISKLEVMQRQLDELDKRITLVKRMKQNMGHTALMLSGGGAIAMYHLGTIKALVESHLYEYIHVISGTSGGR
jgi:phage gp36-like protein